MKIFLAKNNKGFSLIEMLVVVAVFATITSIVANIYLSTSRSERYLLNSERVQAELRYATEIISKEVENSNIDYSYYGGEIVPDPLDFSISVLALIDSDMNQTIFRKSSTDCPDGTTQCLQMIKSGWPSWKNITPEGVDVSVFKFLVHPNKDPFLLNASGNYDFNVQPAVTIRCTMENVTSNPAEKISIDFQTTVSSRIYKR